VLSRTKPMKPGKPLRRKTPLKTRAAGMFGPGVPLRRPQGKHARLKPVSDKRRAENRERRAMKERRWPNGERPHCARPGCPRLADDLHEILTRARGGSITDEANCIPLCRPDHDAITFRPESELDWAYSLGLLRHSWHTETGRQ
jgi:5-methylcytosine-specific restriction endonuclease McrA